MYDLVEVTNHMVMPINMSLSATFQGHDWKMIISNTLCPKLTKHFDYGLDSIVQGRINNIHLKLKKNMTRWIIKEEKNSPRHRKKKNNEGD